MPAPRQIVALGGGGFMMTPQDLRLDRYLLRATGKRRPRVLFVPTASGDSEIIQLRFFKASTSLDARPSVLELFRFDRNTNVESTVLQQDLIFVGGGNTVAMLDVWRRYGLDKLLRRAYRHGVVLAGISAGANCWFEHSVSDSLPGGGIIDGLGLLKGVFCPHFDGESWRRPFCEAMLAAQPRQRGYAADDGAAAHFVDERLDRCIATGSGKRVYRLERAIATLPTDLLRR